MRCGLPNLRKRHIRPKRQRGIFVSPRWCFGLVTFSKRTADKKRDGLTLLEVILALAIFAGSMAVLSELVATGHRANLQSRLQTIAIIRAESQMNEVIANPALMVSASGMPFPEAYTTGAAGQWTWSLDVQSWDQNTNLLKLQLTVVHLTSGGTPNASFTLTRFVRDPQVVLESGTATTEETLF